MGYGNLHVDDMSPTSGIRFLVYLEDHFAVAPRKLKSKRRRELKSPVQMGARSEERHDVGENIHYLNS